MAQRARYPGQDASRADVGVLVERLTDGEPQSPEADVIGHLRRADRAEIDRVMALDLLAAVRRHHEAGLAISVRAPIELIEAPFQPAVALGDRLQDLEAGRNDLLADAVAGNDRDPIAPHGWVPGFQEAALAAERAFQRRQTCPRANALFHITRLATWNGKE